MFSRKNTKETLALLTRIFLISGKARLFGRASLAFYLCAFLILIASPSTLRAAALSADDQATIAKAENYLNEIKTIQASFMQASATGGTAQGMLHLARPGGLRMDYDEPSPVLLITSGGFLVYHDKQLVQTTYIDLDSTLAGFLIRPRVALNADGLKVTDVVHEAGALYITLVKPDNEAMGQVTLTFSESPFALKQWRVVDPQGQDTRVSLFDMKINAAIDPKIFEFADPAFFRDNRHQQ